MCRVDATDLHDYEQREMAERVAPTLDRIRRRGDTALLEGGTGEEPRLRLTRAELERCRETLPASVQADLSFAQKRTRAFAEAQRSAITDFEAETLPGMVCGVRNVPVESAGLCLPADADARSLPALQAGVVAATVAGVKRIAACVPPSSDRSDRPSALLIGALALAGVSEIYLAAGVPALAALTFGTESIPRVEVAFGPCDAAMTAARHELAAGGTRRLRRGVLVIADESANPALIAADLIAGQSTDADANAVLITTSAVLAARVASAVDRQLDLLPCPAEAARAWQRRGMIRLVSDPALACALANRHGLERVELMTESPRWYLNRLDRCRQVFVGEAAGIGLADGLAEPVTAAPGGEMGASVASFLRPVAYYLEQPGDSSDAAALVRLRRLAGLESHARACELRATRDVHPAVVPALSAS